MKKPITVIMDESGFPIGEVKRKCNYGKDEIYDDPVRGLEPGKEALTFTVTAVYIMGHDAWPVAIFRYAEQAEQWGRDNFFGQWLTKQVQLELPRLMTKQERGEAMKRAEEILKKLK